jgi:hypothetical protein
MEINLTTFFYLFLRLAPFVLVCFFSLLSIFNYDLKGVVYLFGIIISILITIPLGNLISSFIPSINPETSSELCDIINIGGSEFSSLPIGQIIIGFTSSYLLSTIFLTDYNSIINNWPTIGFFSLLVICDIYWNNYKTNCYSYSQSIITYTLSGIIGYLWALTIVDTKSPELQYFPKYKNNELCKRTSEKTFKCRVYKNGKLVQ